MNSSEIAKLAGVSRSTVSRVINNYSNVPEKTRKKVLKVIEEHEYVPHASARMLAGSQNRVIGLFIVDLASTENATKNRITKSPYYLEFTSSVIEMASELKYTVLVHIVHKTEGYEKAKEYFYNKTISGGIFIGQSDNDESIRQMIERDCNIVLVDQSMNPEDKIYNKSTIVNADNKNGAYQATKYLIEKNHKKIVHLTGGREKFSSKDRIAGYIQALEDASLPVDEDLIIEGDFIEKSGYQATKSLLEQKKPFTAIFASNDKSAFGAVQAIQEQGLRVPEDISVIGFDDIDSSKYFQPPLTSMRMELVRMADLATRSLIQSIEGNPIYSRTTIPVTLVERESCQTLIE